jgi:hypothetical protein
MPCVTLRALRWLLPAGVFLLTAGILLWERGRLSPLGSSWGSASRESLDEDPVDRELQRSQERILAKHAVVGDLLARRLTLRQAAARFGELDASMPESLQAVWRKYCPGNTDEERYCWTVLRYVAWEVHDDPVRAQALRRRLEAELPEHLRRRLPAGPGFGEPVP